MVAHPNALIDHSAVMVKLKYTSIAKLAVTCEWRPHNLASSAIASLINMTCLEDGIPVELRVLILGDQRVMPCFCVDEAGIAKCNV